MSSQMGFRALLATKSTLKWFIVIGIILVILGVIISFFAFGGLVVFWIGVTLIAFSAIALMYLWLTEKYLPGPQTDPVRRSSPMKITIPRAE